MKKIMNKFKKIIFSIAIFISTSISKVKAVTLGDMEEKAGNFINANTSYQTMYGAEWVVNEKPDGTKFKIFFYIVIFIIGIITFLNKKITIKQKIVRFIISIIICALLCILVYAIMI